MTDITMTAITMTDITMTDITMTDITMTDIITVFCLRTDAVEIMYTVFISLINKGFIYYVCIIIQVIKGRSFLKKNSV
jgi:hypothetical protein